MTTPASQFSSMSPPIRPLGLERADILRIAQQVFRDCPQVDALRKTLVSNEDIHGAIDWLVETIAAQWSGPSDLIRPACSDFVLRHVAAVKALNGAGAR